MAFETKWTEHALSLPHGPRPDCGHAETMQAMVNKG